MMKKEILMLALSLIVSIGYAQSTLQIVVENVRQTKGTIRVGMFNSEESFPKEAFTGKVVKAMDGKVTITLENLKPGEYAFSLFHDENENGELDKSFMGIPKEGFAFGNNSMGTFGPPSFEKAKVVLENGKILTQTISLKYL